MEVNSCFLDKSLFEDWEDALSVPTAVERSDQNCQNDLRKVNSHGRKRPITVVRDKKYFRDATRRYRQRKIEAVNKLTAAATSLEQEQIVFRRKISTLRYEINNHSKMVNYESDLLQEENEKLREEINVQRRLINNFKRFYFETTSESCRIDRSLSLLRESSKTFLDFISILDSSLNDSSWRKIATDPYRVGSGLLKGSVFQTEFRTISLHNEEIYRIDITDLPIDFIHCKFFDSFFEFEGYCKRFIRSLDHFDPGNKAFQRNTEVIFHDKDSNSAVVRWTHPSDEGLLLHSYNCRRMLSGRFFNGDDNESYFCSSHIISHLSNAFSFDSKTDVFPTQESSAFFFRKTKDEKLSVTIFKRTNGSLKDKELYAIKRIGLGDCSAASLARSATISNCFLTSQLYDFGIKASS